MRKTKTTSKSKTTSSKRTGEQRKKLTKRQKMVLDFVMKTIKEQGYPPTLREIGNHMGIRSTNGVNDHLKALERKGYLRKGNLRARALTPIMGDEDVFTEPIHSNDQVKSVPLLGRVAAGVPIPRIEDSGPSLQIDKDLVGAHDEVFALRVTGDSMIEDGIHEGDYLFVRRQSEANNGDIVVAVVDDEVTVKRFYHEETRIRLQPANSQMKPIYIPLSEWRDVEIIGITNGLFRKY